MAYAQKLTPEDRARQAQEEYQRSQAEGEARAQAGGQGGVSPYTPPNANVTPAQQGLAGLQQAGYGVGVGMGNQTQPQQGYLSGQQLGGNTTSGGTPMNGGGLSQSAYEAQQQLLLQGQLAREADDRRIAMLGSASGGTAAGREAYDPNGNEATARAAAFARAKEQAGQTAMAALKGLQGQMAQRGLRGSTIEGAGIGQALGGGTNAVNEFTREQLMQDLNRYRQVADTDYQGRITQRGQDMTARNALLGLTMQGTAY